ncbi:hypothetical protein EXM36_17455 [Clostridium botulinum]|uniref:hypothetical protein n=1 Tax=Clostridium botulinum TaxID=1491 RepID=UPI0004725BB6|nr:hypothetical protein [Clostridium botulinum]APQ76928.1 hypothetical protein RSJ10_3323 [Clostridium botulinum]AUN00493.1 hypothetical protein RSJ13_16330 [Clostridium botulinum]MBN3356439.1 hypothetical protein [Clostridium botulinum]MBN3410952.1 hypothetical protein [Clostridium botulinum]MBY6798055.1 hypothetical protein [Clostridium botulinum]
MKYKIGQEIEFTNSFAVELRKGGAVKVDPGDKAMIVRKIDDNTGEIVYTTGNAKGLSQNIQIEVDEALNEEELAKKILEEMYK